MRTILMLFVVIAAVLGIVMLGLAIRNGGFEQAGQTVDRQVSEAGDDARDALEQAGDAVERATDRATEPAAPAE
ncbi:hypothetical protein [Amorphus sp. 3PC139-8]|uniref:hypothetical protein n=1 Tax=Amorphus sp. 3PC139-8 TaxID=2735676 RepID=UPI00345DF2B7